jgi:hypothetical protein
MMLTISSARGTKIMTATSTSRMVVPLLAFVAACGLALAFAIHHVRREPLVETKAAAAAPAISTPAAGAPDQGAAAFPALQAEANATATLDALSPPAGDGVPAFDIARIEATGDVQAFNLRKSAKAASKTDQDAGV